MSPRLITFRLAALVFLAAGPAQAATGPWVDGEHVRLRLVATHGEDGALEGVIEMELEPGWKTYWRSPGDSGIPPRFDFSASSNARLTEIAFPPPERSDDGFSASNVYHEEVAFPVRFSSDAASEATHLALAADFGVCDEICLPVSLATTLEIPAGERDGAAGDLVRAARAALPAPPRPGDFEILSLTRVGGEDKEPVFEARVHAEDGDDTLLFAETPADWYPAPPAPTDPEASGTITYRFGVDRRTATTPIDKAEIQLTLTEGDASTERRFRLDAAGRGH